MRIVLIATIISTLGICAAAQADDEAPAENKKDQMASAAVSVEAFERVMKDGGCNPDAIANPRFIADAKNAIRPLIHAEDADEMTRNKRHVFMAYAALLVLLAAFLVQLYRRQERLRRELSRLEAELQRAIEDDA